LSQLYDIENAVGESRALRQASALNDMNNARAGIADATKNIDSIHHSIEWAIGASRATGRIQDCAFLFAHSDVALSKQIVELTAAERDLAAAFDTGPFNSR
jgi:hypothetical protein